MAANSVQETRENILRSALQVFSHKGYVGATISAIANGAGVNNLTVFRHFQGKENLFREVLLHHHDIPLDAAALDAALAGKPVAEGLTILSRVFFELVFRNIHIFRIFIIESRHFPWVRKMSWRMPPALLGYLRDYLASVMPPTRDRERRLPLLADMFLAHITRLALQFNKHDSIWEYSENLLNAFSLKMKPQIDFFVSTMIPGSSGGTAAATRKKAAAKPTAKKPKRHKETA
ncbi:MAG: TetR/AcrR family transcriptional regulator [Planctomycetes bacterium]|nr:TetR/AcrR family transcriptional regulator [Planctomycetota bacterium]